MNEAGANIEGIIERTYHIKTGVDSGTAFSIEYNQRQYLITAKHVVETAVDRVLPGETVRIYSDFGLKVVAPRRIETSEGNPDQGAVDVAVLEMPHSLPFRSSTPTLGCSEDLSVLQRVAMPTAEHFGVLGSPGLL